MHKIITQKTTIKHSPSDNFEKGHLFENFIVTLFNKNKYRLTVWRSDKKASNGVFPESNSYPDLEFRTIGRGSYSFAVECKWRAGFYNGQIFWATTEQQFTYSKYSRENRIPVFVAIGVGGTPDNPEKLFVTPLQNFKNFENVYENELIPYSRIPKKELTYNENQVTLF